MREIENIAWDLCCLYYSCKAPIDSNGKLNYFLAGSLAILPLLCADKIEDVIVDENNMVVSIENCQQIDENTRNIFQQYRRKINDVDYVAVSSRPAKKSDVVDGLSTIKDIDILSSLGERIVHQTDGVEQTCNYSICRLTYGDKQIIIPSPIDSVSHKLRQCVIRKMMSKNRQRDEKFLKENNEEYYKQIRDIVPLLTGISNLYSIDRISYRIREILESSNYLDFDILSDIKKDFESYPVITEILNSINSKKL